LIGGRYKDKTPHFEIRVKSTSPIIYSSPYSYELSTFLCVCCTDKTFKRGIGFTTLLSEDFCLARDGVVDSDYWDPTLIQGCSPFTSINFITTKENAYSRGKK
jgi:hypothetical protein